MPYKDKQAALEYQREWCARNREHVREYARKRREECREQVNGYSRRYYERHHTLVLERERKRRQDGGAARRARDAAKAREWRAANRERARETDRRWRAANRDRVREIKAASNRKALYGLTAADFTALVAAQCGLCPICRAFFGRKLVVDHDHATGKVRGLLCRDCNTGIGHLREDPARFDAAKRYLKAA